MWHDLAGMTCALEAHGHRFGTVAILLRSDAHTVQRTRRGREPTEKCGKSLLAQIGGKLLGVLLIRKTAELDHPHARG